MADYPARRELARAAVLGALCGVRTFAPGAVVARRRGWGAAGTRTLLLAVAVGEAAADKHPAVPPRSAPPALIGRLLSGAVLGAALAGPAGAALGGTGAVGAALVTQRVRAAAGNASGAPDALIGAVEDVLVVSVATLVARR